VPFVAPETVAHKLEVLRGHCEAVGRDPREIRCAVNVGLCQDDDALRAQFGALAEGVRPGVLIGSPDRLVQRIGEYVEAGADQVNIAMRAPWDVSLLDLATEAIEQLRTST
jgi:alkanesulfonate monooxygenase SsuD/methylene tetrahydromethanopterin reductase-like flavin-dependent oxidoreductase (luciferase family)